MYHKSYIIIFLILSTENSTVIPMGGYMENSECVFNKTLTSEQVSLPLKVCNASTIVSIFSGNTMVGFHLGKASNPHYGFLTSSLNTSQYSCY